MIFSSVVGYGIPMTTRFRGIQVREGLLLEGPAGWGEFCPFAEYEDREAEAWLATAVEAATVGWPAPLREKIPVNCTVPAVDPAQAFELVTRSGCRTAKVKVADHPDSLGEDLARLEAVRDALGSGGAIRCDANGVWSVDAAVSVIPLLDRAAGGLEYVEQPCGTLDELAAVRLQVNVRIAADESIRRASDPLRVAVAGAADIAVIKCSPLGGVRRALEVARAAGLPCVVSSALETSVGLAAGIRLAAALPELEFACGLATLSLFTGDVATESLVPVDGYLPVPAAPPLPDPTRYPLSAERETWWRERLRRVLELAHR